MRVRLLPLLIACAAFSAFSAFSAIGSCLAANASQGSNASARESSATHVIGFVAGDHFEQAEALTRAIKRAIEQSTDQRLGGGDFSLEVLTAALGCSEKPDHACLKKIATKISSQRFLWGAVEVNGQRIDAELHLYSEESSEKKVKFTYQVSMTDSMDGDLLGIAANAVSQLLGPLRYRVVVRSSEQTGVVLVDGKEAGRLVAGEATLDVPSGDHQFRLKPAPGSPGDNSVAEQTARVQVAELTKVRLDKSGRDMDQGPVSSRERTSAPTKSTRPTEAVAAKAPPSSNTQRTWGYVTLGAGGILLAGGAAVATGLYLLNEKDNFQAYRNGLQANEDACTEANRDHVIPDAMTPAGVRSLCREASILTITEVVLLASGVVAAGTGLTLLLTSSSATTAVRIIEPRVVVGRGRTDVGVVVRF